MAPNPKPVRVRAGITMSESGLSLRFDATAWFDGAGEEAVADLFDVERHNDSIDELVRWCLNKDLKLRERVKTHRRREMQRLGPEWVEVFSPWVYMADAALWTAVNRPSWSFVPQMCLDWEVDLLVVMARQPARRG